MSTGAGTRSGQSASGRGRARSAKARGAARATAAPLLAHLPEELQERVARAQAAERHAQRRAAREGYEYVLGRLDQVRDGRVAAALIRWIGRTYVEDADLEAALDCCEAALAAASVNGDRSGIAHAVNLKAIVYQRRGQLDEAERLYEDARDRARRAHESQLVAMIAQNMGTIANIRGDLPLALKHYRSSLAQYRALGLDEYVGPLLTNLGLVYTDLRRWRSAERAFDEAVAWCQRAGDLAAETVAEADRAKLWLARKRYVEARDSCERALALAEASGNDRALGEACRHYGVVLRETGEYAEAHKYLQRARQLADARHDLLLAAETAREMAELYRAQGLNYETLQCLNEAHRVFAQLRARRDLADVDRRAALLESEYLAIVRRWGESIEAKDLYTQGHCERVADYACALARDAGLDPQLLLWFRMGALLHDVGKLIVPPEILNKTGPLSEEELAVVRRHPDAGVDLLADIDFPWDIRPMVRHHHERWDGTGYPQGIAGDAIPLAARILCVADVYDALTTTRSYRAAYARDDALRIMSEESGTTLDPALFARFVRLLERQGAGASHPTPFRHTGEYVLPGGAGSNGRRGAAAHRNRRADDRREEEPYDAPLKLLMIGDRGRDLLEGTRPAGNALGDPVLAPRVTEALRLLSAERFDVILLELSPQRNRGLDAVARLHEVAPDTPVLVIGARDEPALAVHAVRAGAQEYLVAGEVRAAAFVRALRAAVERQRVQTALRGMSMIDPLTGLYNRRGFFTLARQQEKLANRLRRRMLHIFLDLDGLKQVNDSYGHREGDGALVSTAHVLRETFRESDVVARLGGDEFAVLALETSRGSAGGWEERLAENIARHNEQVGRPYALAMSIGMAVYDPRFPVLIDDLMAQADAAMYENKRRRKAGEV